MFTVLILKMNLSVNKKLQTLDVGNKRRLKIGFVCQKKTRELDVSHTKIRTLNLSQQKIREFRCGNNRITKMFPCQIRTSGAVRYQQYEDEKPQFKTVYCIERIICQRYFGDFLGSKKMSKIRVHLFERYEIFEKVGSFEAEAFDQCRI